MKWGSITWILLHAISLQIHERHYAVVRVELFRLVVELCAALPCPECSNHASEYLKHVKCPDTKQDFVVMLHTFHNMVNVRLRKPWFRIEHLQKYNNLKLRTIVPMFESILLHQPYNPRFAMQKLATKHAVRKLRSWLAFHRMI
jgi:hypothetical protein